MDAAANDVRESGDRAAERPNVVPRGSRGRDVATGGVLGAFLSLVLGQLGAARGVEDLLLWGTLVGVAVGLTRARRILWIASAAGLLLLLVVGYTPLAATLARGLERRDPLTPAPAVVVLGSSVHKDGTLTAAAQERIVEGYRVLSQGFAPRMVLTRGSSSSNVWDSIVRQQMKDLGLDGSVVEVVGPVRDTHDEAVAVARLARERHWDQVILVTHPWHMRRAAAAFEHEGVRVVCRPCVEGRIDLGTLDSAADRVVAFRYWMHEWIGYLAYRRRGWL